MKELKRELPKRILVMDVLEKFGCKPSKYNSGLTHMEGFGDIHVSPIGNLSCRFELPLSVKNSIDNLLSQKDSNDFEELIEELYDESTQGVFYQVESSSKFGRYHIHQETLDGYSSKVVYCGYVDVDVFYNIVEHDVFNNIVKRALKKVLDLRNK